MYVRNKFLPLSFFFLHTGTSPNPSGLYVETCHVLISECGVALNIPDAEHGRTAAHWATYYHRDDILAELIIAGIYMYKSQHENSASTTQYQTYM